MAKAKSKHTLTVALVGQDELTRNFQKFDMRKRARARDLVNRSSLRVMNEAKKLTPVDMGRLRASISVKYYQNGLTAEVSTNVGYGAFVEFGTGPRGKQGHPLRGPLPPGYAYGNGGKMPPLDLILEWVKRKGIRPKGYAKMPRAGSKGRGGYDKALRSIAFLIARAIAKRGQYASPFMFPALEMVRPEYDAEIKGLFRK